MKPPYPLALLPLLYRGAPAAGRASPRGAGGSLKHRGGRRGGRSAFIPACWWSPVEG